MVNLPKNNNLVESIQRWNALALNYVFCPPPHSLKGRVEYGWLNEVGVVGGSRIRITNNDWD